MRCGNGSSVRRSQPRREAGYHGATEQKRGIGPALPHPNTYPQRQPFSSRHHPVCMCPLLLYGLGRLSRQILCLMLHTLSPCGVLPCRLRFASAAAGWSCVVLLTSIQLYCRLFIAWIFLSPLLFSALLGEFISPPLFICTPILTPMPTSLRDFCTVLGRFAVLERRLDVSGCGFICLSVSE
jgi:hypothetical protein